MILRTPGEKPLKIQRLGIDIKPRADTGAEVRLGRGGLSVVDSGELHVQSNLRFSDVHTGRMRVSSRMSRAPSFRHVATVSQAGPSGNHTDARFSLPSGVYPSSGRTRRHPSSLTSASILIVAAQPRSGGMLLRDGQQLVMRTGVPCMAVCRREPM